MSGKPKIHQIQGYIQMIYLVEYDHGLLLLDSGCVCDVDVVLDFIKEEVGRSVDDLKLVVVTHAHPDHSGGANEFKDRGFTIAGSSKCNDWYKGVEGLFTYLVDILLTYLVAMRVREKNKFKSVFFPRKVDFDIELNDGDVLPEFSDWTVLSCPGHTASDLSLYHDQSNTAYVADNLISSKSKFFRPYPIVFPRKYKESLSRYMKLGISNFLLAHYGEHQISTDQIFKLIEATPLEPRRHKTTLPTILVRFATTFLFGKKRSVKKTDQDPANTHHKENSQNVE